MNTQLLKQYGKLKELNQRVKYISDIYYIGNDGYVYMNSLVEFIEKVGVLNDNVDISAYYNSLMLPNKTFGFTSKSKKRTMDASSTPEKISLFDTEDSNICLDIDLAEVPKEEISNHFNFYKNLDAILDNMSLNFIPFTDEQFDSIAKAKVVYLPYKNTFFTITKHIFMCVKKTDNLSYVVLDLVDADNPKKKYVLFRKDTKIMSIYTLSAFLCFD